MGKHAVSTDLIHWERKGLALCPDENGTAYTGSAIVDKKNLLGHGKDALLFYHTAAGGKNEWSRTTGKQFNFTQRLYYSTDGGETLVRDDRFLMEQIAPLNRDPRVFYFLNFRWKEMRTRKNGSSGRWKDIM